jgi:hypothetical protein
MQTGIERYAKPCGVAMGGRGSVNPAGYKYDRLILDLRFGRLGSDKKCQPMTNRVTLLMRGR